MTLGRHSPVSLFQTCINLVAQNLDHVESFFGFPALIGEKIFMVAMETQRMKSNIQYITQALQLFVDAFEEEVLSSLNLSGRYLGLNYSLEQLLLFKHLIHMDMSRCGIGDEHEMITQVQNLNNLQILCLSENSISNAGLQKMTAPYRMFQRGPAGLSLVDISGNKGVDSTCLKYFLAFRKLEHLVLSGKNISHKTPSEWSIAEKTGTVLYPEIHTEGWASGLVDQWMSKAEERAHQKSAPTKSSGFYMRHSIKESLQLDTEVSKDPRPVYVATRKNKSATEKTSRPVTSSVCNKSKRDRETFETDISHDRIINMYSSKQEKGNSKTNTSTPSDLLEVLGTGEQSSQSLAGNITEKCTVLRAKTSNMSHGQNGSKAGGCGSKIMKTTYNDISQKNRILKGVSCTKRMIESQKKITDFTYSGEKIRQTEKKLKLVDFSKPETQVCTSDVDRWMVSFRGSHVKKIKLIKGTKRDLDSGSAENREAKLIRLDCDLDNKPKKSILDILDKVM